MSDLKNNNSKWLESNYFINHQTSPCSQLECACLFLQSAVDKNMISCLQTCISSEMFIYLVEPVVFRQWNSSLLNLVQHCGQSFQVLALECSGSSSLNKCWGKIIPCLINFSHTGSVINFNQLNDYSCSIIHPFLGRKMSLPTNKILTVTQNVNNYNIYTFKKTVDSTFKS